MKTIELVVRAVAIRMYWETHCLFVHLTLIHVSWTLIEVAKWHLVSNDAQHIGWCLLHVGGDALNIIASHDRNIHVALLKGTDKLGAVGTKVPDGSKKARRASEEIQARVLTLILR